MYGNLAYDEDSLLHCLEPTQHSWVLDPNYIKAQNTIFVILGDFQSSNLMTV